MQDSSNKKNFGKPSGGGRGNQQTEWPKEWLRNHSINYLWITNKADETMIDFSDEAGKYMAKNGLTNSKIRSIYGEIKRIQMGNFEKERASFLLLRPKVAYALGRDNKNKGLELFKLIFDQVSKNVTDQKSFINFCNLFESILAFHKSYGGKD